MLTYKETTKVLNAFNKSVVRAAKLRLKSKGHNVTSKLYKSIKGSINKRKRDSIMTLEFFMAKYGKFLDQGVKGTKSNYIENKSSPFSFNKNKKSIGSKNIEGWVKKRNLRFRNKKTGRFERGTVKSLTFLIARSIHEKGIKRTMFFTRGLKKRYALLPSKLATSLATDMVSDFTRGMKKTSKLKK
tara:strand:- start:255 stop:812 length:558 start_codon:yes stop_codon:yes gene_type:complete